MNNRREYKYLIEKQKLGELRAELMPYLDYDPFAGSMPQKEYTVRSVYFDTIDFKCYHEKAMGIKNRNKYRLRGYNSGCSQSEVYLEIKRKDNEFISKNRALFTLEEVSSFLDNTGRFDNNFIYHTDALKWLFYYHSQCLLPTVLVLYEREAFQCKFGSGLRVTFDKNLRSSDIHGINEIFSNSVLKKSLEGFFILEVKFVDALPHWLLNLLVKYDLQRTSVSKYLHSIEANTHLKNYAGLMAI